MSAISCDLEAFLEVVHKVAAAADENESPAALRASLDAVGLLSLGPDTAQERDSAHWLSHTVRIAAQSSPSVGFLLATRYAADLTATNAAFDVPVVEPTFTLAVPAAATVVATALLPQTIVAVDVAGGRVVHMRWDEVADRADPSARTGLEGARFVSIVVPPTAPACAASADAALAAWDLLTGAALAGLARRAVTLTQSYVNERIQFGVPIGSFAGLRALVADMDLKACAIEALLDASLDAPRASDTVSATAGRAALEICIGAIQAHGGYGYIDEYPIAGLLRDAISLQARAGGRRLHVSRLAERTLGPCSSTSS